MMNPSHIPPGLEYLGMIDQIIIKQKVQLLEVFTGFESANKYAIKNSMGQDIFFAAEDTDCCTRNCCGPIRPFGIKVLDNFKREVMYIERPLRCDSCWFPCCLQVRGAALPHHHCHHQTSVLSAVNCTRVLPRQQSQRSSPACVRHDPHASVYVRTPTYILC